MPSPWQSPRTGQQHAVSPDHKLSTLHYEVIRQHGPFCEVRILLETGRYHQIRAQFAHVGCPIVNDSQYGATRASWPAHRIALHHSELEIIHPTLRSPPGFAEFAPRQSLVEVRRAPWRSSIYEMYTL